MLHVYKSLDCINCVGQFIKLKGELIVRKAFCNDGNTAEDM